MSEKLESQPATEREHPSRGKGGSALNVLASLRFALAVVALIALACVAGTLVPQGEQVEGFLAKHPEAQGRMELLSALGLTHVFVSSWFLALLCALAASLAVCTVRRWAALRGTSGSVRARIVGSLITHVSLLIILAGGIMRGLWAEKGTIGIREGETVTQFATPNGKVSLPFAVHLVDFEIELNDTSKPTAAKLADQLVVRWPAKNLSVAFPVELGVKRTVVPAGEAAGSSNAFQVTVARYVPDFVVDSATRAVQSRSATRNNPAILVQVEVVGGGSTNEQWVFARFPGFGSHASSAPDAPMPLEFAFHSQPGQAASRPGTGNIKDFKSTLQLMEGGAVVREKTIEVNSPISYRGYTLYQMSYNPEDLAWTCLEVVRDPSVPVVYSGFALMMAGLTIAFCVSPWLGSKRPISGGGR